MPALLHHQLWFQKTQDMFFWFCFFKQRGSRLILPRPLYPDRRPPCDESHGLSLRRCRRWWCPPPERKRGGGRGRKGKGRVWERRTKKGGDSGCSCSCGPGGELPSPGCSAETSMGGCVGSHHDSSGSLNENSDGTGGNSANCFGVFSLSFSYQGLPLGSLPAVRSKGPLRSLYSRARQSHTGQPPPGYLAPLGGSMSHTGRLTVTL